MIGPILKLSLAIIWYKPNCSNLFIFQFLYTLFHLFQFFPHFFYVQTYFLFFFFPLFFLFIGILDGCPIVLFPFSKIEACATICLLVALVLANLNEIHKWQPLY